MGTVIFSDHDSLFILLCDHFPDPDHPFVTRSFAYPDPDPFFLSKSLFLSFYPFTHTSDLYRFLIIFVSIIY